MKTRQTLSGIALLLLWSSVVTAAPLGTAFTYQGRLHDGSSPANGLFDLRCAIYDTAVGGSPVAGPITNSPVSVSNGLFTTTLDFSRGVFLGEERWLEIGVWTNGGGAFSTLSPRQPLTPAPYALYAPSAGAANNAFGVAAGVVGNVSLAPDAVTSDKIADGTIAEADLSPVLLSNTFWRVVGNAGTTAGTHFLGTTDNQPLELKVDNQRGLRLEPGGGNNVNVIGGWVGNSVAPGVIGATVGGGGGNWYGWAYSNRVEASFGTVSGGLGNTIQPYAQGATLGGGRENTIQTNADHATIGGGYRNTIQTNAQGATLGGGRENTIQTNAYYATIGGGWHNTIQTNAWDATLGGGYWNTIQTNASGATIGGGAINTIQTNAQYATIGGGAINTIQPNAWFATIGGGWTNTASGYAATIGGGQDNVASNSFATIGGGKQNAAGIYGTVPGGVLNHAVGQHSLAAGQRAKANHPGAFVWADATDADFASTTNDQFNVRATGGVRMDTGSGPGISLSAADTPLITRGWDPFGVSAPAAKQGHGRWGLFMESFCLAIGIPDLGGRYFEIAKYATNGTSTPLLTLDQGGNLRTTTGVIGTISDRNLKTDFAPVDGRQILERLLRVPIQTWRFKDQPVDQRHMGAMAQDFHATFGVGLDERTIATVDADGVALAAIQGLNEKVEAGGRQSEVRMQKLEAENAQLRQRLAKLEQLVKALVK